FNLYEVWQLIQEVGGPSKTIKVTGGFLNSSFWKHMLADIFDRPLQQSKSFESSCLGAVLIGMDIDNSTNKINAKKNELLLKKEDYSKGWIQPNEQLVKKYQAILPVYQKVASEMSQVRKLLGELNH
ncbi:MAG: FGGY-family carbohydrate kinase, partial [Carnobacterium sp.]